jgi:membrane-associated HD superfamily phosphohydrolase
MTAKIKEADVSRQCIKGLYNQYMLIDAYKKQFLFIASRYQILYFSCTVMTIAATIVLAILGFAIVSKGWANSDLLYRALFLSLFFYTTFLGLVPKVYEHDRNAERNITKYFTLTNLQNDIYNIVAIKPGTYTHAIDSVQCKVFNDVNQTLKENRNLFIDIKADEIPTKIDVSESLPVNGKK